VHGERQRAGHPVAIDEIHLVVRVREPAFEVPLERTLSGLCAPDAGGRRGPRRGRAPAVACCTSNGCGIVACARTPAYTIADSRSVESAIHATARVLSRGADLSTGCRVLSRDFNFSTGRQLEELRDVGLQRAVEDEFLRAANC
jgi:hypothetical protein